MKKRIMLFFLAAAIFLLSAVPVFAQAGEYVIDETEVLSGEEIQLLDEKADAFFRECGIGVYFAMTSEAIDADAYAQTVYEERVAGTDAVLLAVTETQWYLFSSGEAQTALTEGDEDLMWDAFDCEETWYGGVDAYLEEAFRLLHNGGIGAATEPATENVIPEERQLPRLVDDADLLTDSEETALCETLDEISERQGCDVAVVTVGSLEGKTATAYADDFYDYNGYGMGDGDDGILLLISVEDRDWAMTTYGYGITAFTDAGQEYLAEEFRPALSDGAYAEAFQRYSTLCDEFLTQAKTGVPYDAKNLPKKPLSLLWIPGAIGIGVVIAFCITAQMKGKLKTVRWQAAAADYLREDSLQVTQSRDIFLYADVDRREKPKDSGSSTHSSSSGRSHGGSSGSF